MWYTRPLLTTLCFVLLCPAGSASGFRLPEAPPAKPVPTVTEVPQELRDTLKLDPFYQKYVNAGGLPVLSSAKVSDRALLEAAYLIGRMLSNRQDVLRALVKNKVRFAVMAPTEMTTDVPEQRNMKPKDYWDKRARGLGGRVTSCGEENLLNLKGDRYYNENILVHEFSHAIHQYGLRTTDPQFDSRLRTIYKQAMDAGLWKKTYAATDHKEYWAEGVQSYFDCNAPAGGVHNDINTREKLAKYDPDLFQLIDEAFSQPTWRYVRYDARNKLTADSVLGLALRGIGPALTPGRVADIAVDPRKRSVWYVATASGGLWKTTNRGTTWKPIFDNHGSYSLGCVTLDPNNPDVVWLGTGENQSQRSVGFGDGVYRSGDGGQTWKSMGLHDSEHIAKILIDPRNSAVVFVAAQGSLWAPGGDRGLYKTTDGGKTWVAILGVSEHTGVTDVAFDPRNPNVFYAASYQRRRNVGVLVGGGPESAIYKSEDGGAKWTKLTAGLPEVHLGRIALAVSPQKPDVVYALITAAKKESGFFRSTDGGATWERQSKFSMSDPQYYGEIYPDPNHFDRVYAMDINIAVTDDGGKKFQRLPWAIHSDNHAITFDPHDPDHLLVGNDGGLYETYDNGRTWRHFTNMPTTQYYRVAVDNALPFYNVYGGSQDNGTTGIPSRTLDRVGIRTSDAITVGGADGMQPRVDPQDPDTVYTTSQNGAIVRFDKRTSTAKGIRPKAGKSPPVRWNWDSPFIISPHSRTRLCLAGSRLFRSDDRGDNWTPVSPDLTRQLDRKTLTVMGKIWGPDAVTPNLHTTDLSVGSALAESPLQEGLLYFGTDDGLVQVSEDGGKQWRKQDRFPGVPEMTYVSCLWASGHDENTVYAAFNNHQRGDFKPYLLRSTDRGQTWVSIAGDLPDRHVVWSVVEDHVNKDLLFVGTEFGLFFTVDGGKRWVQLRGGVPTIAFRDLAIQRRESDLVAATFGRGFFILDDYTPLRHLSPAALTREGVLFPLRKAYRFYEQSFVRAASGNYTSPNPPFGAVFTYYLRDAIRGANGKGETKVALTVSDASGKVLRKIEGPTTAGFHRLDWDLRAGTAPAAGKGGGKFGGRNPRPLVEPGKYTAALAKVVNGVETPLGEPQVVEVVPLPLGPSPNGAVRSENE